MDRIDWKKYYKEIDTLIRDGQTDTEIATFLHSKYLKDYNLGSIRRRIGKLKKAGKVGNGKPKEVFSDKKEGEKVNWREYAKIIKKHQKLKKKVSKHQDYLKFNIPTDETICVMVLGDTQLGSFGTDYELFEALTDEIISTPNLYVIIVGDILQMAIKMRGVAEVLDNAISPSMQMDWLESWLEEIEHKVIASTWDNHSVMREENQVGYSLYERIFASKVPFFRGIGEIELTVGKQEYNIAASHFFRGKSMYNKAHAPMRYMREMANHIEIAVQGDFHQPGILVQEFGGTMRYAIVCGSIQTNSTYAKRFFSLRTLPNMPCFTLHPEEHIINTYNTIGHYLNR